MKKDKGKPGRKFTLKKPNSEENLMIFEKKMSNYFSIGIDARIGLGNS